MTGSRIRRYLRRTDGSSAVEFALVLPIAVFITVGAINLCLLLYGVIQLNQATDLASRYASVQIAANGGTVPTALTGSSTTTGSVAYYATNRYLGPGMTAAFSYSHTTTSTVCNNPVTATGSFQLLWGLGHISIPISAQSCYA